MKQAFISILVLAMAASCEPTANDITPALGAEYFPLKTGAFAIYDVDSTDIQSNVETNYQFQLRLEVKSTFTNGAGNDSYIIQRQKRNSPDDTWTEAGNFTAWTDARSAISAEGNQLFVRLKFPINVGNEWNGNEMNSSGGDDDCGGQACDRYEVSEVEPDVVVSQSDVEDEFVKYDVRKEVYSKDIGLIYKEVTVLEYCTADDCFGEQFVDKGVKYTQTLVENGQM